METVRLTERTGKDGVLQFRIPLGRPNADFDVVVLVQPRDSADSDQGAWTDENNVRRCQLIDRKLQGSLSDAETIELEALQHALRRHVNHVAPLPIEGAKRLHAELLEKQKSAR